MSTSTTTAPPELRALYESSAVGISSQVDGLIELLRHLDSGRDEIQALTLARSELAVIQFGVPDQPLADDPDPSVVASFVKVEALLAAAHDALASTTPEDASLASWVVEFISFATSEFACRDATGGL